MLQSKPRIHDAACDTWDLPKVSQSGALHPEIGKDTATDRYLASIAPAYGQLGRVLAQLSGIFLLALTRTGGGLEPHLHLDHAMYAIAHDQLEHAHETIQSVSVPERARRHHAGLSDMIRHLSDAALGMDRLSAQKGEAGHATAKREILKHMAEAQRLLIATAEPDAGVTPVDFNNACCSCASPGGTA